MSKKYYTIFPFACILLIGCGGREEENPPSPITEDIPFSHEILAGLAFVSTGDESEIGSLSAIEAEKVKVLSPISDEAKEYIEGLLSRSD